MLLGQNAIRESLVKKVALLMGKATCNLNVACNEYLSAKDNSKNNLIATDKLLSKLKNNKTELAKEILIKKISCQRRVNGYLVVMVGLMI